MTHTRFVNVVRSVRDGRHDVCTSGRAVKARFDIVLVGGGLQNGLIALAALHAQPRLRIAMIERADTVGGNHTWCFHAGDVPPELARVVDAITTYRWDGYTVRFPGRERVFHEPYAGTCSPALATALTEAFRRAARSELRCGVAARSVLADRVELETGEVLTADLVVDARGPQHYRGNGDHGGGYQKFAGVELGLARPHGLARPLLMDATVRQVGGFRFFYVLPLAADRVLVEDTTFSRDPSLDGAQLERGCLRFAAEAGLELARVIRTEHGVLPMPGENPAEAPARPLRAGYEGGWFHPATGYSFPIAARLASFIAGRRPSEVVGADLDALWRAQMRQTRFCHRLNRLLFDWFQEGDEWHVFERFYRLPAPVIRRFYALETSAADRARILIGRPPRGFSLRAGLRARLAR
jgi:lycopene beta-cyclase